VLNAFLSLAKTHNEYSKWESGDASTSKWFSHGYFKARFVRVELYYDVLNLAKNMMHEWESGDRPAWETGEERMLGQDTN
jgi:hypothetical protein